MPSGGRLPFLDEPPQARTRVLAYLLLVFLSAAAFGPTLRVGFQLDDHVTIATNPTLSRLDAAALREDFLPRRSGSHDFYYRPLQNLANRWVYRLSGRAPFGYHLLNGAFHAANAILVLELILAVSGGLAASLITAALFAVHPLIVSELLMVSGIPELMSFFFSLAAVLLLLRPGRWGAALGALACALALLSKESGVAVPFYFALLAWITGRVPLGRRLALLGAVTAAYAALRLAALSGVAAEFPLSQMAVFAGTGFPKVLLRYAGLTLWPWPLHSYRLIPSISPLWGYAALAGVGLLYARRSRPAWARFSLAWILISFLPKVPVLATGHYMLEHWFYPALPAALLPIGMAIAAAWHSAKPARQIAGSAALAVLLLGWIFSARYHIQRRDTDEKNYRWSLQYTRATPLLFNLGLICLRTGRAEEGLRYIEPVYNLYPDDPGIARAYETARTLARR